MGAAAKYLTGVISTILTLLDRHKSNDQRSMLGMDPFLVDDGLAICYRVNWRDANRFTSLFSILLGRWLLVDDHMAPCCRVNWRDVNRSTSSFPSLLGCGYRLTIA